MHQNLNTVGVPAVTAHFPEKLIGPDLLLLEAGLGLAVHGGSVHCHQVMHIECLQALAQIIHIPSDIGKGTCLEKIIASCSAADRKVPASQFFPQLANICGQIPHWSQFQGLISSFCRLVQKDIIRGARGSSIRPPDSPRTGGSSNCYLQAHDLIFLSISSAPERSRHSFGFRPVDFLKILEKYTGS